MGGFDRVESLIKRPHREWGEETRRAAGRERVIGAGHVIAEGLGRVFADEDGSGVPNFFR